MRAALGLLAVLGCLVGCAPPSGSAPAKTAEPAAAERKPLYYRSPMNAAITSPVPAKDEMGMDFVPVYADSGSATSDAVHVSAATMQRLGIGTAEVVRTPLPLEIRGFGRAEFDERLVTDVYAPTDSWVTQTHPLAAGLRIESGQPLVDVYSTNLETTDRQYLQAVADKSPAAESIYANNLRTLGLTDVQIRAVRDGHRQPGHIPLTAPVAGVIMQFDARMGAYLRQGERVIRIAPQSSLRVRAWIPLRLSASIASGDDAQVTSSAHPGTTWPARVEYVYPESKVDAESLELRLALRGPPGALRANEAIAVTLAAGADEPVLNVPREAAIRDGRRDRVVVALASGGFAPREVRFGRENGTRIEVLSGLEEHERVVRSGLFLIDSEADINASLSRLSR